MSSPLSQIGHRLTWAPDLFQVLVLNRLSPARRHGAIIASSFCRTVRVHSRSKIPELGWAALLQELGLSGNAPVMLPGPLTATENVGDANYYFALGALVRALQPRRVLEIGTYLGVGTCSIAMNAGPNCRIFTVDLPDGASATEAHALNSVDRDHVKRSRGRVGEAFLGSPYEAQIAQLRADSLSFRAEDHVSDVDLTFIDGGHSLPCITKDTENAIRVTAPDGLILWDDYFHLYPEVVAFLDKLHGNLQLCRIAGTNLVLHSRRWTQ